MESAISFATTMPFVLVALVLGVIGALKGLSRGAARQLIRVITIVASVIIAYFVTKIAYDYIMVQFSEYTPEQLADLLTKLSIIKEGTDTSWVSSLDPESLQLVCHLLLALLVAPLFFVISFIIIPVHSHSRTAPLGKLGSITPCSVDFTSQKQLSTVFASFTTFATPR